VGPCTEGSLGRVNGQELNERERQELDGMLAALSCDKSGWNLCCNICGFFGASACLFSSVLSFE
jgi:hypothetical protein